MHIHASIKSSASTKTPAQLPKEIKNQKQQTSVCGIQCGINYLAKFEAQFASSWNFEKSLKANFGVVNFGNCFICCFAVFEECCFLMRGKSIGDKHLLSFFWIPQVCLGIFWELHAAIKPLADCLAQNSQALPQAPHSFRLRLKEILPDRESGCVGNIETTIGLNRVSMGALQELKQINSSIKTYLKVRPKWRKHFLHLSIDVRNFDSIHARHRFMPVCCMAKRELWKNDNKQGWIPSRMQALSNAAKEG